MKPRKLRLFSANLSSWNEESSPLASARAAPMARLNSNPDCSQVPRPPGLSFPTSASFSEPLSSFLDERIQPSASSTKRSKNPPQKKEQSSRDFFGRSLLSLDESPLLSHTLSGLLHQDDHSLSLSILATLLLIDRKDHITKSLVALHGHPDLLLLRCLEDELLSTHDLSLVARERTPAVLVLKEFLFPFTRSVAPLLASFLKFGENLKSKNLRLFCEVSPTEEDQSSSDSHHTPRKRSQKLRKKLSKETMKLLSADSFPIELCILCHRCSLLIESIPDLQRDKTTLIENWAVTALLFLRFIVPMISTHEKNPRGMTFLGRFMMKLCCRSKFSVSGKSGEKDSSTTNETLVNSVLDDCFDSFDKFCFALRQRGRAAWGDDIDLKRGRPFDVDDAFPGGWEKELLGFVEKHADIIRESKKMEKQVTPLLNSFCEELKKNRLLSEFVEDLDGLSQVGRSTTQSNDFDPPSVLFRSAPESDPLTLDKQPTTLSFSFLPKKFNASLSALPLSPRVTASPMRRRREDPPLSFRTQSPVP